MTVTNFLIFCLAYLIDVASPGPGVMALVARVLSQGLRGIVAFIAGFVIGDLVWFTFAATVISYQLSVIAFSGSGLVLD